MSLGRAGSLLVFVVLPLCHDYSLEPESWHLLHRYFHDVLGVFYVGGFDLYRVLNPIIVDDIISPFATSVLTGRTFGTVRSTHLVVVVVVTDYEHVANDERVPTPRTRLGGELTPWFGAPFGATTDMAMPVGLASAAHSESEGVNTR